MKLPNTPADDINNALRILGMTLPQTDQEIEEFLADLDAEETQEAEIPDHLSAAAIVAAIKKQSERPVTREIPQFPSAKNQTGLSGLRMAARNGDGILSEKTLRKMEDAQED